MSSELKQSFSQIAKWNNVPVEERIAALQSELTKANSQELFEATILGGKTRYSSSPSPQKLTPIEKQGTQLMDDAQGPPPYYTNSPQYLRDQSLLEPPGEAECPGTPIPSPILKIEDEENLPFCSKLTIPYQLLAGQIRQVATAVIRGDWMVQSVSMSQPLSRTSADNKLDNIKDLLGDCRASIAAQGEKVKLLKKEKGVKEGLQAEIALLVQLKQKLADLEIYDELSKPSYVRCRQQLDNLCKRRSIFFPSFEIYGGIAGLYDWGPPGCALKSEVETMWRRLFVLEEDMLEISGTCLTPYAVLQTSGHVERFCDLMTADSKTGECFRADKLLEDFIDLKLSGVKEKEIAPLTEIEREELELIRRKADSFSSEEMEQLFLKLKILSPLGNTLTPPYPFNLMFKSKIGPKQDDRSKSEDDKSNEAFLRPETAQGIFVNFRRLLEFNGGRLPLSVAQLGLGFRNEINPRNGLLRVREFQMGEIEHFVDPENKRHPKFKNVAHLRLPLYSQQRQLTDGKVDVDLSLEDALTRNIIDNETLAYFMARTFTFLIACGIQPCGLRFRQHLKSEMAHYATDCWDAEIETSFGWVECVGIADRSAFDLSHHTKASNVPLVASRRLAESKVIESLKMTINRPILGPAFKKNQNLVVQLLESKTEEEKAQLDAELNAAGSCMISSPCGQQFQISRPMVQFKRSTERTTEESFVPAVIEPSFGIGRIIYCLLEHTFRSRNIEGQEERCYLALPPAIAPVKCSLLSISANDKFHPLQSKIKKSLINFGISCKIDDSGASIGKRYARTDEIGIPFGITIDFQSLMDESVTLRERDSMKQIRIKACEIPETLRNLINEIVTWESVLNNFPIFYEQQESS